MNQPIGTRSKKPKTAAQIIEENKAKTQDKTVQPPKKKAVTAVAGNQEGDK